MRFQFSPKHCHIMLPSRSMSAAAVAMTLMLSPMFSFAGSFHSLSARLPATTDTVVAVNVDQILESPLARKEQWRQNLAESWGKRPSIVPPGVTKLLMGAEFVPSQAETRWEVTLMEMPKMPSVKDLTQAEGGYVDRVWDKDAVVSPANAYFVPVEADVLAVCTPAERSLVARWLRQPVADASAVTSAYIKGVLDKMTDSTDMVIALDLESAFSLPKIRRFLANSELEELKGKDLDAMALSLSTIKGLEVTIDVDDSINGDVAISFGKDVSLLADVAKPLLITILKASGMHIEDLADWKFSASGSEVRANGKLSDASFRNLVGIVQSPVPALVDASAADAAPQAPVATDPATASQQYFKSVSLIIDNLKTGTYVQETAKWWLQASKRIDKLPILYVDPALVEWGTTVSMNLKELAGIGSVGQTKIQASVAGVATPDFGDSYWDGSGGYHYDNDSDNKRASAEYARQRKQVALEQRSQVQQQAIEVINQANGSRQKIRAEMTQKYNVEF